MLMCSKTNHTVSISLMFHSILHNNFQYPKAQRDNISRISLVILSLTGHLILTHNQKFLHFQKGLFFMNVLVPNLADLST